MATITWDEFWPSSHLGKDDLEKSGLSWDKLMVILEDYRALHPLYSSACRQVAETLQECELVHSTRHRTKKPDHLVAKIIRKRLAQLDSPESASFDWGTISMKNYKEALEDLAGVRALHLFKEDWVTIDYFIGLIWTYTKRFAYVRDGDDCSLFKSKKCEPEEHPAGYRSVHYVLDTAATKHPVKVEVQVRTIFEEGWSEIDHRVRYPNFSNDPLVRKFLADFNLLSGLADSMGNFVCHLKSDNEQARARFDEQKAELDSMKCSLAKVQQELEKSHTYNGEVKQQLDELKLRLDQQTERGQTFLRKSGAWRFNFPKLQIDPGSIFSAAPIIDPSLIALPADAVLYPTDICPTCKNVVPQRNSLSALQGSG